MDQYPPQISLKGFPLAIGISLIMWAGIIWICIKIF